MLDELTAEWTRIAWPLGLVSRSGMNPEHDALRVGRTVMIDSVRKRYRAQDSLNSGAMNGSIGKSTDPKSFVRGTLKGPWGYEDELARNIV